MERYKDLHFFREDYQFRGKELVYNKIEIFHKIKLNMNLELERNGLGSAMDTIIQSFEMIKKQGNLVIILVTNSFFPRAIAEIFRKGNTEVIIDCSLSLIVSEQGVLKLKEFNKDYF